MLYLGGSGGLSSRPASALRGTDGFGGALARGGR
jgi:hypothetical protein